MQEIDLAHRALDRRRAREAKEQEERNGRAGAPLPLPAHRAPLSRSDVAPAPFPPGNPPFGVVWIALYSDDGGNLNYTSGTSPNTQQAFPDLLAVESYLAQCFVNHRTLDQMHSVEVLYDHDNTLVLPTPKEKSNECNYPQR